MAYKKHSKLLTGFLLFLLLLTGCNANPNTSESVSNTSTPNLQENSMLHFTFPLTDKENYPNPYIGDVHPYFDEKTNQWYMFYLDTTGQFNSKLLTSSDGITWVENKEFWIHSGLANYGVLNVFERNGVYYSYYADYHASKSTDLINWYYAGGEYQIPQDKVQFPGGMRDPSVTFDEATSTYYAIGLNYPRRVVSEGIYQSNLAITRSLGDNQLEWEINHVKVFANDAMNKDFECPQLVKIGRRWYVVASQYGNSVHGVGKTSYLIGDLDKNPYEVNWQSKTLNHLSSEDLCAAQIAQKGDKHYIFGWIPRDYNGGFWGGYINLPTEVYALEDGSLATRLDQEIATKYIGDLVADSTQAQSLQASDIIELDIFKRFDNFYEFEMESNSILQISQKNNNYRIVLTNTNQPKIEVFSGSYLCFSHNLRPNELNSRARLRVIGEAKNLEIELNNRYVLTSRIERSLSLDGDVDTNIIQSIQGQITIHSIISNKLNYLNDIQ